GVQGLDVAGRRLEGDVDGPVPEAQGTRSRANLRLAVVAHPTVLLLDRPQALGAGAAQALPGRVPAGGADEVVGDPVAGEVLVGVARAVLEQVRADARAGGLAGVSAVEQGHGLRPNAGPGTGRRAPRPGPRHTPRGAARPGPGPGPPRAPRRAGEAPSGRTD